MHHFERRNKEPGSSLLCCFVVQLTHYFSGWHRPETMKCLKHDSVDAVAVCAYCGRALCRQCILNAEAPRLACSSACAEAMSRGEKALEAILQQNARSAQASAFYCYLCGGLSATAAVVAWFLLPSTFLILFTAGAALVLLLSGIWYSQAARKRNI
jgi:hypothetical protein